MIRTVSVTAALVCALAAVSPSPAQDAGAVVLDIRSAGIDGIRPHAKDAGVLEALRLLDARLVELPGELDGDPEAPRRIQLGWDLLTSAMAMRVVTTDAEPGFGVALTFRDGADAGELARRVIGEVGTVGLPTREGETEGATIVDSPMGPIVVTTTDQPGGTAASFTLGDPAPAELAVNPGGLPEGSEAWMSVHLDLPRLTTAVMPMIEMQDPVQAQALRATGWVGPDAPVIDGAVGALGPDIHAVTRMINARAAMSSAGITPELGIQPEHLRVIPENPTRLMASVFSMPAYLAMYDNAMLELGEDPLTDISAELGVDVRADLLENLGPRWIAYQADQTGGGGLFSTVAIVELKDAAAFGAAHANLVAQANDAAAEYARGYVRVRGWDLNGHDAFTLTAPGIPVPLEPSWAVVDGKLIVTLSPVSLREAVRQAAGGGRSVLDTPEFQRVVLDKMPASGAGQLQYLDVPRVARRGYGLTSMLTSAIANGVRSPQNPDRVEGPLMPPYGAFVRDTRAAGSVTWWEGDDYIQHAVMDRSMLVMTAAGAATLADMQGVAAPALMAGILLPALGKARASAKALNAKVQVRSITQAMAIWSQEHGDNFPDSFRSLIDDGFIPAEILVSPLGPAADGGPDYAMFQGAGMTFDATQLCVIDRASYFAPYDGTVIVGFADGHAESVSFYRLEELLGQPNNEGAREAFGID